MFFTDECFNKNNYDSTTKLPTSKNDINNSNNNCCIQQSTCSLHTFSADHCCLKQTKCEVHKNLHRGFSLHKTYMDKDKFDEEEELFELMLWNLFTKKKKASWVLKKYDDGSVILDKGGSNNNFNGLRQNPSQTASGTAADESKIQSDAHNKSISNINFIDRNISFEYSFRNFAADQENLDSLPSDKLSKKVSVQETSSASKKDLGAGKSNELLQGSAFLHTEDRKCISSITEMEEGIVTKGTSAEQHENNEKNISLLDLTDPILENKSIKHANSTQENIVQTYAETSNVSAGIVAEKTSKECNIMQGNVTKENVTPKKVSKITASKSNNLEIEEEIVPSNILQQSSYISEIPEEKNECENQNFFPSIGESSNFLQVNKSKLKSNQQGGNAKEYKQKSKLSQHADKSQSIGINIIKSNNSLTSGIQVMDDNSNKNGQEKLIEDISSKFVRLNNFEEKKDLLEVISKNVNAIAMKHLQGNFIKREKQKLLDITDPMLENQNIRHADSTQGNIVQTSAETSNSSAGIDAEKNSKECYIMQANVTKENVTPKKVSKITASKSNNLEIEEEIAPSNILQQSSYISEIPEEKNGYENQNSFPNIGESSNFLQVNKSKLKSNQQGGNAKEYKQKSKLSQHAYKSQSIGINIIKSNNSLTSGIRVMDDNSNKTGQEKLIEDISSKCVRLNNFEEKKGLLEIITKKVNAITMKHLQGNFIKREKSKLLDITDLILEKLNIRHANSTQGNIVQTYSETSNDSAGIVAEKTSKECNIMQGNVTKENVTPNKVSKITASKLNNLEIEEEIAPSNILQQSSYILEIPEEKNGYENKNSFPSIGESSNFLQVNKSKLKSNQQAGNAKDNKQKSKLSQPADKSQSIGNNIIKSNYSLINTNANRLYSNILAKSIGNTYEVIHDINKVKPQSEICNVNILSNFQKECNLTINEQSISNDMSSNIKKISHIKDLYHNSSTVCTYDQEQSHEWKTVSNRKRYKNKNNSKLISTETIYSEIGIQVLDDNSNKNGQEKLIEDISRKCARLNNFEEKKGLLEAISKKMNAIAMKHLQGNFIKREKQKLTLMEVSKKKLPFKKSMGNYAIKERMKNYKLGKKIKEINTKELKKTHKVNDKQKTNSLRELAKDASNGQNQENISSKNDKKHKISKKNILQTEEPSTKRKEAIKVNDKHRINNLRELAKNASNKQTKKNCSSENVNKNNSNEENSLKKQKDKVEKNCDENRFEINFLKQQFKNSEGIIDHQIIDQQLKTLVEKYFVYRSKAVEMKTESLIYLKLSELIFDYRTRIKNIPTEMSKLQDYNYILQKDMHSVTDEYELIVMAAVRSKRRCKGLSRLKVDLLLAKERSAILDSEIEEIIRKTNLIKDEIFNGNNKKLYQKEKHQILKQYIYQINKIISGIPVFLRQLMHHIIISLNCYYIYLDSGNDDFNQDNWGNSSTKLTIETDEKLKKYLRCEQLERSKIEILLGGLLRDIFGDSDMKLVFRAK